MQINDLIIKNKKLIGIFLIVGFIFMMIGKETFELKLTLHSVIGMSIGMAAYGIVMDSELRKLKTKELSN